MPDKMICKVHAAQVILSLKQKGDIRQCRFILYSNISYTKCFT